VRRLGGKPAKTGGDVDAAAKERPEEAPFAACGHTTTGCGLGTGRRRRSRHAQNIIHNQKNKSIAIFFWSLSYKIKLNVVFLQLT